MLMFVEHQQPDDIIKQQKDFFALVGELGAVGIRRVTKQENLLIARAGKCSCFLLLLVAQSFYLLEWMISIEQCFRVLWLTFFTAAMQLVRNSCVLVASGFQKSNWPLRVPKTPVEHVCRREADQYKSKLPLWRRIICFIIERRINRDGLARVPCSTLHSKTFHLLFMLFIVQ